MRQIRMSTLGASLLALVLSACGTGGGSSPSAGGSGPAGSTGASLPGASSTSEATEAASTAPSVEASVEPSTGATGEPPTSIEPSAGAGGDTLASTLILGGPPECPERPFCQIGLRDTYGLEFAEFRPLDVGGPLTVAALENGDIDVGLLLTSDPNITAKGFVLLQDDLQLQLADNLIPVVRNDALTESPEIADLLNPWMATLTQDELTALNEQVAIDQDDPEEVVAAWLADNGLTEGTAGEGKSVTVGSTDFYEQEILGEIFAQVLQANGFDVEKKFRLGPREVAFPALEEGEIDILAEYAATALEFVNEGAGEATTDPEETAELLRGRLEERGLTALDVSSATDQNGFVVTEETAQEFTISKLSDLAQPAP